MDRRPRRRGRTTPAVVAVVLVTVLVAVSWWTFRPVSVATSSGEQQVVLLPDGSVVELNSGTTLRFGRLLGRLPAGLSGELRVTLDGEAFFRVVSHTAPFIVETSDLTIEVLGTEFNVRSRSGPAEEGTVVTLATGRVRLFTRSGSPSSVTLSDVGAGARITRDSILVRASPGDARSLDHVLAWRKSGFAVVDRPLQAVLDEIERRYAIEIAPRAGVDLDTPMNLFYLRGATPDQILRDVCLVQNCSYRETSRGFALAPRESTDTPAGTVRDEPLNETPTNRPSAVNGPSTHR